MSTRIEVAAQKPTISAVGNKSEQFKPLKMEVRAGNGKLLRVVELPDPRIAFLKAWRALDN
jgi:hypothetical protein